MSDKTESQDKTGAAESAKPSYIIMDGVTEHTEDGRVGLRINEWHGRTVIEATNEGGHNCTQVDLEQLLEWVSKNKPDLYLKACAKMKAASLLTGHIDPLEAKSKLEKYNLQFNIDMSCTCKACTARRRLERVSTTKTDFGDIPDRMIRCEFCNSNSCPHADDHNNSCTMTGQ